MADRIDTDERSRLLALLADDISIAEAARRSGLPYPRAYRIAQQAGIGQQRWEARRERDAEEQRQLEADRARLPELLASYHRGDLVPTGDLISEEEALERTSLLVFDALCVQPAIRRGNDLEILEALDTLVLLRDRGPS